MIPASLPPPLVGRLALLTDHAQVPPGRSLLATVARAVEGGARTVLVRERGLARDARAMLCTEVMRLLTPVGGALLLAGDPELAAEVGAAGVHLGAGEPPVAPALGLPFGRSCHDADELARAAEEGCGWATLSPVLPTPSKPGYGPALGLDGLARLAAVAGLPVLALGGLSAATVGACLDAGAAAVAVMGAVMRAPDPAAEAAALLGALGEPRLWITGGEGAPGGVA